MSQRRPVGNLFVYLAAVLVLAVATIAGFMRETGTSRVAYAIDDFRQAQRDAKVAIIRKDAAALRAAGAMFARIGGAKSMKTLLGFLRKVPVGEDGLYWALIASASSFRDADGFAQLTKYLRSNSKKQVARDLLLGLSQSRSSHVLKALEEFSLNAPAPMRTIAIQKLGRLRSARAVTMLINVLHAEEKKQPQEPTPFMWLAAEGLRKLTGKEFGPSGVNWDGWWKKQKGELPLIPENEDLDDLSGITGTAVDFIRVDPARRDLLFGVEKAPPKRVVVLTATFTKKIQRDLNNDHMERVLEAMRIPHTVVSREDFPQFDLSDTGVILINCAQFHEFCINGKKPGERTKNRMYRCNCGNHKLFSAKLSDLAIEKLRRFVLRGGFLFCEDWTLKEIVERAFPKFVVAGHKLLVGDEDVARQVAKNLKRSSERSVYLGEEGEVDVVPARGAGMHPYLRGIYSKAEKPVEEPVPDPKEAKTKKGTTQVVKKPTPDEDPEEVGKDVKIAHSWLIDDESYTLRIAQRKAVLPLLVSQKLQKNAAGESSVAVAFRPGRGRPLPGQSTDGKRAVGVVAIVLSHFGKQDTDEDEFALQNLLVNFLLDAHAAQKAGAATPAKARDSKKKRKKEKGKEE